MKLTTDHIEVIRKYFLSATKEEPPHDISSFLQQLKQIFNGTADEGTSLISLLKSAEAEDQLETFQQLQQDYYTRLAIQYHPGSSNADIEALLKSNNQQFKTELDFQKELQAAFLLNERAALKRKFQELDDGSELNPAEIGLAFKLEERQQLKQQFQSIEYKKSPVLKPGAPVVHFNWKRITIAAAVIAAVLATTFYVFDKKSEEPGIVTAPGNGPHDLVDSSLNEDPKQKNDLLAGNDIPVEEKQLKVIKEASLGFADKDEKIITRVYQLQPMISKIDGEIPVDIKDTATVNLVHSLKSKRDFIKNLENKYSFYNGVLSLYLFSKKEVKVFKIGSVYFIQVGGKVYECKSSSKLLPLKLTDKAIAVKVANMIY